MHYIKVHSSKNKFKRLFFGLFFVLIFIVLGLFVASLFKVPATVTRFVFEVVNPFDKYPFETTDEMVNILLLGNAGGKHDGAYLTDTIMVASLNLEDKKGYFISLPRDLWIDSKKVKLNAVYEYAEEEDGTGLLIAKQVVGEILGMPIHYGVRMDFSGFERSVDLLEGIEVDVDKSFDDYLYPIAGKENDLCGYIEEEKEFSDEEAKSFNIEPGKKKVLISPDGKIATDSAEPEKGIEYFTCRYEHIKFKAGLQQMDGETALKFVRSRMGTNGEGNDFARSKRQQKVIEVFRKKLLSFETLVNPSKIKGLIENFGRSLETDLPMNDAIALWGYTKGVITQSFVVSNSGKDSLLFNPPLADYGGAWVLIPKDPTFGEVKAWVLKVLAGEEQNEATSAARRSDR